MNIDILTLAYFKNLNIEAKRGSQNSGGGMACLMNAATAALSPYYRVNLIENFDEIRSDFVILDAVVPTNKIVEKSEGINYPPSEVIQIFIEEFLAEKASHPDRKFLLWCAEKSILRWMPEHRDAILKNVDLLAVTDPYLWQLLQAIEIVPSGFLCDAVNPDLFRPAAKRNMSVISVGALKYIKNIDYIIDVYARLEGTGVNRIYLGGASLWSQENRPEDHALIESIEAVTDVYMPNASVVEVAYQNAHAAISVNNTWHDCSSRANEELLMSGVIWLHGEHPLFKGRPGYTVKTPEAAVEKIYELTDGFKELPAPQLHAQSRQWALENVSTDIFLEQFKNLVRYIL